MSKEAIENLKQHQQQLDADGSFVGVSRQALEEALDYIALLEKACEAGEQCQQHLAKNGYHDSRLTEWHWKALRAAGYLEEPAP